ncbi:MAG: hypothetical protein HRT90_02240 [Candidatus Margulisbacteria bacterium]|nr:hypothetical protein [Candidatus Margulisiibacteriota bacterium]
MFGLWLGEIVMILGVGIMVVSPEKWPLILRKLGAIYQQINHTYHMVIREIYESEN